MTTWVLLRGLAREARHWGGFTAGLQARVPAGDSVLAIDLAGTGVLWDERSPASVPGLVRAARRELALLRAQPPFVLVGLSLGGMVAAEWTARDPQVRGCVLVNTSVGDVAPFWQRLRPASYLLLLRLLRPGMAARERERVVLRLTSNGAVPESLLQAWAQIAQSAPVGRGNALRQLWAAVRYRLPQVPVRVPKLLLASRADRLVSVACSRRLAQAWGAQLREHAAAGHDLPLDDPAWVIEEIVRWHAEQFRAVTVA